MPDSAPTQQEKATRRRSLLAALRDGRGAVMTEYVVLLGVCCIAISAAIIGLGPHLIANYERSQGILLSPFP